jgi:hypothetical protein
MLDKLKVLGSNSNTAKKLNKTHLYYDSTNVFLRENNEWDEGKEMTNFKVCMCEHGGGGVGDSVIVSRVDASRC